MPPIVPVEAYPGRASYTSALNFWQNGVVDYRRSRHPSPDRVTTGAGKGGAAMNLVGLAAFAAASVMLLSLPASPAPR
jgi:hypothetical protein